MPRQHSHPLIVSGSTVHRLVPSRVEVGKDDGLDESWFQNLLFENPETLPVEEIEPVFGDLIPICRELPTGAGPLDILYGTSTGLLTLVECKLWKNPEARREVVGQILDYAKELSRWSYDDLQKAVIRSNCAAEGAEDLFKLLAAGSEDDDEARFIDNVKRNLRRGRFLLLIVGEGIRESVNEISEFLQNHAHLNFAFALVETALFKLPEEFGDSLMVAPRVLCRTVEIERAVVRVEGDRIVAEPTSVEEPSGDGARPTRTKLSEQVFYESLGNPDTRTRLKQFFARVKGLGLMIDAGSNSLMIKTEDGEFNFAVFRADGTVRNMRIAKRSKDLGIPQVGEQYLEGLANLFDRGEVDRTPANLRQWSVKKDGRFLTIEECLQVQDQWLELMRQTTAAIDEGLR